MKYFVKFWETFLKSNNTKKKFVLKLIENLKKKWVDNIQYRNAYLLVDTDKKVEELQNVFWVHKIEQIKYQLKVESEKLKEIENNNLSDNSLQNILISLFENVIDDIVENYDFSSFRISVKRENKQFPVNSMDLQMILWKYIWEKYWKKASYKNFELDINIRILKDEIWVWTNKDSYMWIGGLPYWIEWKSLNLFSGGIDSPVATFLAAKRWIKQHFLFLNIPWSDLLLSQVYEIYDYLKRTYGIEGRFFNLNISNEIKYIKQNVPAGYRQIIFKKLLYKISDKFAYRLKLKSVVNGENLWQVSTQTLSNMELLDRENHILNIRPLICYDKIEIIDQAKKIWTYKFSEKIKETCSLEEHSDARIKDFSKIDKIFNDLNFNLDNIVSKIEEIKDYDFLAVQKDIGSFFVEQAKWAIIDIEKIEQIPTLDKEKEYIFVCSSWYKASQKALEYRKKWYKTYYTIKN